MSLYQPNSTIFTYTTLFRSPDEDFLLFLGKRVRRFCNLRGMTRKTVARESDVSERHLAQVEAGAGNVSIVLLHRIAATLNADRKSTRLNCSHLGKSFAEF